jgi:hypothetical protein
MLLSKLFFKIKKYYFNTLKNTLKNNQYYNYKQILYSFDYLFNHDTIIFFISH